MRKTLILALFIAGCSGAQANPSDGAVIQVMQESYEDMKAPAGQRPQRTLAVVSSPTPPRNMGNETHTSDDGAMLDTETLEGASVSAEDRMRAEEMAQDGRLKLIAGERDAGVALLEASVAIVPTVDALEALIPALEEAGEHERVLQHCEAARKQVRRDARARLDGFCQNDVKQ